MIKSAVLDVTKVKSFLWQHILLFFSLYLMTLGVVLCIKSGLGSSTISSIPYVMALAGEVGKAPEFSVGGYTILMNCLLVVLQILVLRRRFEPMQLFQLVIGFFFGWLIDLNGLLLGWLNPVSVGWQAVCQLAGCTIMGIGIAFEVKCASVTMPGEGITMAISQVSGKTFHNVKIVVDTSLVVIAVVLGYIYFGRWMSNVIGIGTLFAMVYVGLAVKFVNARIDWFDRLLHNVPGFRRTLLGLARFLHRP